MREDLIVDKDELKSMLGDEAERIITDAKLSNYS